MKHSEWALLMDLAAVIVITLTATVTLMAAINEPEVVLVVVAGIAIVTSCILPAHR